MVSMDENEKENDMEILVMLGQAAIGFEVLLGGLGVPLLGAAAIWHVSVHGE